MGLGFASAIEAVLRSMDAYLSPLNVEKKKIPVNSQYQQKPIDSM